MTYENPLKNSKEIPMTPQEAADHEKFEKNRRILQGEQGKEARRLLERHMDGELTPEEKENAGKPGSKREDVKPRNP